MGRVWNVLEIQCHQYPFALVCAAARSSASISVWICFYLSPSCVFGFLSLTCCDYLLAFLFFPGELSAWRILPTFRSSSLTALASGSFSSGFAVSAFSLALLSVCWGVFRRVLWSRWLTPFLSSTSWRFFLLASDVRRLPSLLFWKLSAAEFLLFLDRPFFLSLSAERRWAVLGCASSGTSRAGFGLISGLIGFGSLFFTLSCVLMSSPPSISSSDLPIEEVRGFLNMYAIHCALS